MILGLAWKEHVRLKLDGPENMHKERILTLVVTVCPTLFHPFSIREEFSQKIGGLLVATTKDLV